MDTNVNLFVLLVSFATATVTFFDPIYCVDLAVQGLPLSTKIHDTMWAGYCIENQSKGDMQQW